MKFKLDLIYSDLYQLKNILRSIIHSILFCRLLIPTKPEVVDCSIFNLTYVKIRNDKIDKKIEEYINEIYEYIETNKTLKLCNVNLFLNYVNTKYWLKSKILWEEWIIPIQLNRYERLFNKDENNMSNVIKKILEISDNNYEIPPIFSSNNNLNVEDYFEIDVNYDKQTFGKTAINILKSFSADFPSFSL